MQRWFDRVILCGLIFLVMAGTGFANDSLMLRGLVDEDVTVPLSVIKELPTVTEDAVAVNSSGRENHYTVTGALFSDVLAQYGKKQENILGIRLVAGDGYAIDVPAEVLAQREIILAYLIDDKPLDQKTQPLRAIILEERAMYWVRNLIRIEILDQVQSTEVTTIRLLESLAEIQPLEDYTYYADVDKALNIRDTIDSLGLELPERVLLKASDGFEKNEAVNEFLSGYIKMTGANAPLFLSPELPKGMHVKDILFFTFADNGFVSYTQALELYQQVTVDDVVGIPFTQLMLDLGMVESSFYRLTATDGYAVEVSGEDMANGVIYLDDQNRIRSYFPQLKKNTSVRGLYTIEAL